MEVYQDVARRLGQPVMVVADKDPAYFEAGIAPGLMDGIVLFKRPEAAVFSIVKRKGNALNAMVDWCFLYGKALSWADTFCRRVVYVSYEEVAATPVAALRAMCTKLELPAPEHDYRWMPAKTYHYLGGNGGTHTRNKVQVDVAWVDALPKNIAKQVQEHNGMQRIFEDMMARRLVLDGTPPAS
jgi:hypothetical protein